MIAMSPAKIDAALERGRVEIYWDNDDLWMGVDIDEATDKMHHVCVGRMYAFVGSGDREILRGALREGVALAILNAESAARGPKEGATT